AFERSGRQSGDEGAGPAPRAHLGAEHAVSLEDPDRLTHPGAADLEARGELPLGRQQVPDGERAAHDLLLDRVDDQLMRAATGDRSPGSGRASLRSDLVVVCVLDHRHVVAQGNYLHRNHVHVAGTLLLCRPLSPTLSRVVGPQRGAPLTVSSEGGPLVQRQIPRPAEIFELMQFKKIDFDAKRRRLSEALTIEDLRRIAQRRTPAAAPHYTV